MLIPLELAELVVAVVAATMPDAVTSFAREAGSRLWIEAKVHAHGNRRTPLWRCGSGSHSKWS